MDCPNCNKKLSPFKTGLLYYSNGKRFCSFKCKKEYKAKIDDDSIDNKISSKSINEEKYKELNSDEKKKYVKEWVCKCNECGKKWAYLDSVKKQMNLQATSNAIIGCGMCCNPCGALFSNKSIDVQKEIKKLSQCPGCNSSNAKCESRYFKK